MGDHHETQGPWRSRAQHARSRPDAGRVLLGHREDMDGRTPRRLRSEHRSRGGRSACRRCQREPCCPAMDQPVRGSARRHVRRPSPRHEDDSTVAVAGSDGEVCDSADSDTGSAATNIPTVSLHICSLLGGTNRNQSASRLSGQHDASCPVQDSPVLRYTSSSGR